MYLKCTYCDGVDSVFVNIPESCSFEIRSKYDDGLYLIIHNNNDEIMLRDFDYWCQGRPNLPRDEVNSLYNDMVAVISQKITTEHANLIDVDAIEENLMVERYAQKWIDKKYVDVDDNGKW